MNEIIARKVLDKNGEEIIELDLNKPWPKRSEEKYPTYMDEIEKIYASEKRMRKRSHEFIEVLN